MLDLLQSLVDGALQKSPFPPTSRYSALPTTTFITPDGRAISYVRRRFLPAASSLAVIREHLVREGDRLDTIAAAALGDPEQFWRIADASDAMHPRELLAEPGATIAIALPEGFGGPSRA